MILLELRKIRKYRLPIIPNITGIYLEFDGSNLPQKSWDKLCVLLQQNLTCELRPVAGLFREECILLLSDKVAQHSYFFFVLLLMINQKFLVAENSVDLKTGKFSSWTPLHCHAFVIDAVRRLVLTCWHLLSMITF